MISVAQGRDVNPGQNAKRWFGGRGLKAHREACMLRRAMRQQPNTFGLELVDERF